ncbi:hypothetical protein [Pseudooceanicola sp. MF1-13]|uniref:hypothetical protein n=1 Tax=Pseudooceanicola sp. MF1-13 TaxID=3379095 RepID=UPI003891A4F2
MKKVYIAAACAALTLAVAPAHAGNGKLSRSDGFELKIDCKGSGCKVQGKKPGGKWGLVEKGKGGRDNYLKLVSKYEAQGFKLK